MGSVTEEPDYVRTYEEDEQVTVRKGDLRAVLDALSGSLDFGSGFLVEEQVEAMRVVAVALDIDPNDVTPTEFKRRYLCDPRGFHRWGTTYEDPNRFNPSIVRRWHVCQDCATHEDVQ